VRTSGVIAALAEPQVLTTLGQQQLATDALLAQYLGGRNPWEKHEMHLGF
jgi:hypothetical protein